MNNLAKITLSDDALASRLYDGLQEEVQNESVKQETEQQKRSAEAPQKAMHS